MHAILKIPSPLRRFTDGAPQISVEASTVKDALAQLYQRHPEIRAQLEEDGKLRHFVNLYLDSTDIAHLDGLDTVLVEDCELRIVPAIAGGTQPLPDLSPAELSRYSRHLLLPEVGKAGQQKLKASRVLIIGAGGLGSPLCLYLAAAGVGTLGIVDHDQVDETNLQRQVIFGVSDIGSNKAERAAARVADLNPNVRTRTYTEPLTSANALEILADYDVVIDGTDNFPTRYLVNDACVLLNKPNVYGSIFRFEGQASVFNYDGGPCYRCLYPEPPPPGMVPSCAEGGVLGVLPATIASMQANEALKIITGSGKVMSGRLVLYDALYVQFHELELRKNPQCPMCGDNRTIDKLIDYNDFCGFPATPPEVAWEEISVAELKRRIDAGDAPFLLDVREDYEREICSLQGARHIPKEQVESQLTELDSEQEMIVFCKTGGRSAQICELLLTKGFKKPVNLKGGIMAWANEIDQGMQKY